MKVKRIELTGSLTPVEFPTKSGRWLVKNFSEDFVYASFKSNATEEEMVKIAPGMGQVVIENENKGVYEHVHREIYIKGTGEVEVQQLCYR